MIIMYGHITVETLMTLFPVFPIFKSHNKPLLKEKKIKNIKRMLLKPKQSQKCGNIPRFFVPLKGCTQCTMFPLLQGLREVIVDSPTPNLLERLIPIYKPATYHFW